MNGPRRGRREIFTVFAAAIYGGIMFLALIVAHITSGKAQD